MGVFAPLVGIIGAFQAMEAIKLLAGVGETLAGRLMLFDALASRWHEVRLAKDPNCRVCGAHRAAAEGEGDERFDDFPGCPAIPDPGRGDRPDPLQADPQ